MIYLDNASTSFPKPTEVRQAVNEALQQPGAYPSHGGHGLSREAIELLHATRQAAAGLLGLGDPARVILTASATDALNMAIAGLVQDRDHVISTNMEHNAVARPLTHLQMKGRISLTRVEVDQEGRVDPEAVGRALGHRTRLVVVGHGCAAQGTVQPIDDIARLVRDHGARLLVDAAHTAGVMPVDVDGWGVDAVAVSGHKGLFGPPGTGMLLLGPEVRLKPYRIGDSGVDDAGATQPLALPWALEAGMPNLPGIAGLRAGIEMVARESVPRIREHVTTLVKRFIGAIGLDERFRLYAARGDLPRTGTVSFRLSGVEPRVLASILEEHNGIVLGAGLHGCPGVHQGMGTLPEGTLRVSVGWFNTEAEIDCTVAALRQVADEGVSASRRSVGSLPSTNAAGLP